MPYPLTEWWFWVFVAPELIMIVGWLVFLVLAGTGMGIRAAWRKVTGRDDR